MKKGLINNLDYDVGSFYHPPLLPMPDIPVNLHFGAFMTKRKHDVHTGVDLYVPNGTVVYAIENGEIVKIRDFTGAKVGMDFWNPTKAIDIEGYTGTICYGEIEPINTLAEGVKVHKGEIIGHVVQVLKKDKGKPMSMLHFAMHRQGWKYLIKDQEDPESESFYDMQIDPTNLLIQLKNKADIMTLKERLSRHEGDW